MKALLEQTSQHGDQAVPSGWMMSTLGACCEKPEYGVTASASSVATGPKFLRITDIQDGLVDWKNVPYCDAGPSIDERKFLCKNDIVIARIGATTGKAFLVEDCPPAIFASYLIRVRANVQRINPHFLYYYLQTSRYWEHIEKHRDDRLKGGVNIPILAALSIPLPSADEQALIVQLLSLVQRGVAVERSAQLAAEQLKHTAMRALFSRGLRGEPQKETEIGPVPRNWEIVPLGSLGRIGNGTTPNRTNVKYWSGGTVPWITSGRMYERSITGSEYCVTPAALRDNSLPLLQPGTVLIAIVGQGKTLGHCAVLAVEATVSRHVGFIQPNENVITPEYLRGYLESRYQYLRQLASGNGSTRGALTGAILRSLQVPLPQVDEQRDIVAILDAIDRKIDLHKRKRAVLEELFKALLHKLMTGEIRVADLDLSAIKQPPALARA